MNRKLTRDKRISDGGVVSFVRVDCPDAHDFRAGWKFFANTQHSFFRLDDDRRVIVDVSDHNADDSFGTSRRVSLVFHLHLQFMNGFGLSIQWPFRENFTCSEERKLVDI